MKTVVVLSGGMDSVTMLHKIVKEGDEVKAISFNYGQVHVKELEMAKIQCEILGIEHRVVDVSFLKDLLPSALTGTENVPQGHYEDESMKKTVVPFRNTILASIALGYAAGINYDRIALGVHAGDHAIYPDCRPEFIEALGQVAAKGDYRQLEVYAPFLNISKVEILTIGTELGVDYSKTWTSYSDGNEAPDYRNGSSVERTQAFIANRIKDPLYTDELWLEAVEYANTIKPNVT
jgi:7-cyano-7-deazaguanine synthase